MECPELKTLIDQIPGKGSIPPGLRAAMEQHMDECRTCLAGLTKFIKISQILENTVYGDTQRDKRLDYISHIAGKRLNWSKAEEEPPIEPSGKRRFTPFLLLKLVVGILVASALGASAVLILGHFGLIGGRASVETVAELDQPAIPAPPGESLFVPTEKTRDSSTAALSEKAEPGEPDPGSFFERLNSLLDEPGKSTPSAPIPEPEQGDSAKLFTLEAELGALRDAASRTPEDRDLRKRVQEKSLEVIAERRRLEKPARVADYYGLGYMHYLDQDYPQTAIVTSEGIRLVRIGPVHYLHYLKAMAHYRNALKAQKPLPSDTSRDEAARVRGALLRAQLDAEGRKQAIAELRRSIAEFGFLLTNPELEQTAKQHILECNEMIEQIMQEN